MADRFSILMSVDEIRTRIVGKRIQILQHGYGRVLSEPQKVTEVVDSPNYASSSEDRVICLVKFEDGYMHYVYLNDAIEVYEN